MCLELTNNSVKAWIFETEYSYENVWILALIICKLKNNDQLLPINQAIKYK